MLRTPSVDPRPHLDEGFVDGLEGRRAGGRLLLQLREEVGPRQVRVHVPRRCLE